MTTHRAPRSLTDPDRPVERAVDAAPVLRVLAGPGCIRGMIRTSVRRPLRRVSGSPRPGSGCPPAAAAR
ncbi:morphogenic membrane protein MmpA [Streptomyces sp. NPDC004009]